VLSSSGDGVPGVPGVSSLDDDGGRGAAAIAGFISNVVSGVIRVDAETTTMLLLLLLLLLP